MLNRLKGFLRRHPILLAPAIALYGLRMRRYGCGLRLERPEVLAVVQGNRKILISMQHAAYSYHNDIAREFDYYFNSVVPEKMGKSDVADFSAPKLHAIPGLEHKFKFTSFPEGKETNQTYLDAFKVAEGDCIIDAGAYCGLTSYLFSRATGPSGRVIAIEADPANFIALTENIKRSGAKNIETVHAALWSEEGELEFQAEGNMGGSLEIVGPRRDHLIKVPTLTLMGMCEKLGISRVDHVKMDIEGAEYGVILSSQEFIKKYRPDFIIEAHNESTNPVNVPKLVNFFENFGYDMKLVKQSEFEVFPLLHFTPPPQAIP